jgi:hypothetical protein
MRLRKEIQTMLRQDRFSLNGAATNRLKRRKGILRRRADHRLINRTPTVSTVRHITSHILSDLKLSKVKLNIWRSRLVRAIWTQAPPFVMSLTTQRVPSLSCSDISFAFFHTRVRVRSRFSFMWTPSCRSGQRAIFHDLDSAQGRSYAEWI